MHVHLIGVCGTGMGSLAGLLARSGHRVTGSDTAFHPPMGDALRRWGVETREGFDPAHLQPAPDLVIVGNVCRADNPEARAAIDGGLRYASLPGALADTFLAKRKPFVVTGTHGKTTTSTLLAFLLDATGRAPGFLVGGLPVDFEDSFRSAPEGAPFVVEGDEYDTAFFEKTPKMWHYLPHVASIGSIEHDHVDIYPDMASYLRAFEGLVQRLPADGLLVANAADAHVRELARAARCRVVYCALDGDNTGDVTPTWLAAPVTASEDVQPFDLFVGGSACGRAYSRMHGRHNVANALTAMAMAAEGAAVPVHELVGALPRFGGVRRRQELRGIADGVRVYDDFAHHPSAVAATLRGMRARHPRGTLFALFEPRSATSSRRLHQDEYAGALAHADVVLLAPVGRKNIAQAERLDVAAIAATLRAKDRSADTPEDVNAIVERVAARARDGDTVVVMSNGDFGGIHERLLARLALRAASL